MSRRILICATAVWACMVSTWALAGSIYKPIDGGADAVIRDGRQLFLSCSPPPGASAKAFLAGFLKDPRQWETYAGKGAIVIRFDRLNGETQRKVLLAVFEADFVDGSGWNHVVKYSGRDQETLWSLCEWLTGNGSNYKKVAQLNGLDSSTLQEGQRILIPGELLLDVMKRPTPERLPLAADAEENGDLVVLDVPAREELSYVTKNGDRFALYHLKKGEALYTAVVVRFTDFRDNGLILEACKRVQEASGIADVHSMEPGTKILIPEGMLSAPYKPEDSPERRQFEEVVQEARRLEGQVLTRNLEGVVVIIDSGHGGRDHGAAIEAGGYSLYEDEVNYDIACRLKNILETQTRAKVYMTVRDRSQGYTVRNDTQFRHDTDEELLTAPPYRNDDADKSANLRWYLANSIYGRETKNGTDPRKAVFLSIHTDSIFNDQLRGAMVYIPGAPWRPDSYRPKPVSFYDGFAEVREAPSFTSTAEERKRDEALSRNFAATILDHLGAHQIKRHSQGAPIRSVIRQSGGVEYVPAMLRYNKVPTKVLIETANMRNSTDRQWLSEPWWRQRFAEALADALKAYYGK